MYTCFTPWIQTSDKYARHLRRSNKKVPHFNQLLHQNETKTNERPTTRNCASFPYILKTITTDLRTIFITVVEAHSINISIIRIHIIFGPVCANIFGRIPEIHRYFSLGKSAPADRRVEHELVHPVGSVFVQIRLQVRKLGPRADAVFRVEQTAHVRDAGGGQREPCQQHDQEAQRSHFGRVGARSERPRSATYSWPLRFDRAHDATRWP